MLFPGKLRLTQGHNKHLLGNNLILAYIIFKLSLTGVYLFPECFFISGVEILQLLLNTCALCP